jgi:hypothetical protein
MTIKQHNQAHIYKMIDELLNEIKGDDVDYEHFWDLKIYIESVKSYHTDDWIFDFSKTKEMIKHNRTFGGA